MQSDSTLTLEEPTYRKRAAIKLIGQSRRYNAESMSGIPEQWATFNALGIVADEVAAYGVCYNTDGDGNMDYLCGIEVESYDGTADGLDRLTIPAQEYVVFRHDGHVSEIREVWQAIWNHPSLQTVEINEGPELEYYNPGFNPTTGDGGYEIWLPIKR